jgi:uncharacterized cupin superfamily protein
MTRPDFIKHWTEIEPKQPLQLPNSAEQFGFHTPYSRATGLSRLRINHVRLAPGMRLSPPGAMRDEEEFFYVIEGAPDLWCDGHVYRLGEGEAVGFKDRSGIAHTFLNNTQSAARLLVVAEASRYSTKLFHSFDQAQNQNLKRMGKLWENVPAREMGPHDGLTDARRVAPAPAGSAAVTKPDFVADWKTIQRPAWSYPGSIEKHGLHSKFGRHFGFGRIGVHHEVLPPGARTAWPHAERDEEEFVFVLEGEPDCWIDGELHRLRPGDGAGFPDQTGICHVFINNTPKPARLIVAGEASRVRSKVYYPMHPARNKEIGEMFWADWPARPLGPHDGMPDALRDRIAKGASEPPAAAKALAKAAKNKARSKGKR